MSSQVNNQTIRVYNNRASFYEAKWKAYLNHTHKAFLRDIETTENDIILDVSGGTGLLAKMMIDKNHPFKQLVINDPSAGMLDIARKRLSNESNINFTNYSAEDLSFEANHFDRILCLNSFHFYTEQEDFLKRCYTMLRPDGKLYLLDWNRVGFFRVVNKIIKWSTSAHIATRSLIEYEHMLRQGGFAINKTDNWNWRYWKFFFVEAEKTI
ncbi:MAG: class I SAM-dependent methyltransferase [Balneolaceae bacterium]|nr:class I SAM-dependent methyltransferase [Balneolaceae bacterium]